METDKNITTGEGKDKHNQVRDEVGKKDGSWAMSHHCSIKFSGGEKHNNAILSIYLPIQVRMLYVSSFV